MERDKTDYRGKIQKTGRKPVCRIKKKKKDAENPKNKKQQKSGEPFGGVPFRKNNGQTP